MLLRHSLFLCLGLLLLAAPASAQQRGNDEARTSPNASVSQTIGTTVATVGYSRPSVRDREIFGDLVPYDAVWRTGANEATTITFSGDVTVEGQPLSAGTYGLFTIPGEDEWTVIFNEMSEQWGAGDYDMSRDALRVTVEASEADDTEMMTFSFEEVGESMGKLVLRWDETAVALTIGAGQ
ncbi:MAG: DUF2911 domain-containing protein [Rhodothermales bacterium]